MERALIALQPLEAEPAGVADEAREAGRLGPGRHAAAALTDVDLDQHVEADARGLGGGGEVGNVVGVVGHDTDARELGGIDQAPQLGAADDLGGDEDVGDAGGGHDLGLAELGATNSTRAGVELHLGQRRRLVRLGVRPIGDAGLGRKIPHARDVALQRVGVDHQHRRIEVLDRHGHGASPRW